MSGFFRSRWVDVARRRRATVEGHGLPQGFRASGAAAGIKTVRPALDVGLLVSDARDTTSAARFTRCGTAAPPVLVTRDRARLDALRAVAVNSGNANAATGAAGHGRGRADAGRRGDGCGRTTEDRVAVCSTGVIGVQLDGARSCAGCWRRARRCGPTATATSSRRS